MHIALQTLSGLQYEHLVGAVPLAAKQRPPALSRLQMVARSDHLTSAGGSGRDRRQARAAENTGSSKRGRVHGTISSPTDRLIVLCGSLYSKLKYSLRSGSEQGG